MLKIWLTVIMALLSFTAHAVNVVSINAEWLWDHNPPHEGRVVGTKSSNSIQPPTAEAYNNELRLISKKILDLDADIVGMIEIEGEHVLADLVALLPGYDYVFVKGRDTFTGQDVGILTRFKITGSISSNPDIYTTSTDTGKLIRPSKVVTAGLTDGTTSYFVVVAHLISKRNNTSAKDAKRVAQAKAIRKSVLNHQGSFDRLIVLGDFNDTPQSLPLKHLKGEFDNGTSLIQWAKPEDYSYTFYGKNQLIDHILLDHRVKKAEFFNVDMPGAITDHRISVLTF